MKIIRLAGNNFHIGERPLQRFSAAETLKAGLRSKTVNQLKGFS